MEGILSNKENSQVKEQENLSQAEDKEAKDLFDQIELSDKSEEVQRIKNKASDIHKTPKKEKKERKKQKKRQLKQMQSKQKKRNLQLKTKKKKEGRLKKVKRNEEDESKKASDYNWSSDSEDFLDESHECSESFLANLNPQKKKVQKNSSSKKTRLELKEGFQLKELGNAGDVLLKSDSEIQSSEFNGEKKSKRREKKQAVSNVQMLKQLLDKGICIEQQNEYQSGNDEYDNGIGSIQTMKTKKQKGPRIMNRMFSDVIHEENDQNKEEDAPNEKIQFELKPKASTGLSERACSFLKKSEKLKKMRGMQAEVDQEQYEKFMSEKIKKSMSHLMKNVSLEGVEEIQLDVQVPKLIASHELNNSMYVKKIAGSLSTEVKEELENWGGKREKKKMKISREQVFRQIEGEVMKRKSKDITHQSLRNNFKITNLEQLQETRRKNEEKRRKEAIAESDESDEQQEMKNQKSQNKSEKQKGQINQPLNQKQFQQLLQQEEGIGEEIDLSEQQGKQEIENQQSEERSIQPENIQIRVTVQNLDSQNSSENGEQQIEMDNKKESGDVEKEKEREKYLQELEDEGIIQKRRIKRMEIDDQVVEEDRNQQQNILDPNQVENENIIEARKQFKKLRKIANILKIKKRERQKELKVAEQFYDEEAQLGSDNEDHDDQIKNIDYAEEAKEYEGLDLDADLEELIDNAVYLNEDDEQGAFKKFVEDERMRDKEELKKIMRGEFKTKRDNDGILEEIQEEQRDRKKRMEQFEDYMKKREQEQGKGIYIDQSDQQPQQLEYSHLHDDFDEMNEENLKKYLDDALVDSKIQMTATSFKPRKVFPQSVQKSKSQLEKRNTMKYKINEGGKMKRTSSHLNELIMKNKPKPSAAFMKKFGIIKK